MQQASRHGTPARDNQAATLWADLGKGVRNYRRMKRDERIAFVVRQQRRRFEVAKIYAAPLVDETVAGYPWRTAWIIVQNMLFTDDMQDEMMGPEEWYESKRSTGTN